MVGIVSAWPPFLKNARTMLISAGFHPDCLLLRDSSKAGWKRGLNEVVAIVCDSLAATALDGRKPVLSFPLLSKQSIAELRDYEQFVKTHSVHDSGLPGTGKDQSLLIGQISR